MRLQKPFCRLPLRFDAARLRAEVEAAPPSAWADHPDDYPGNQALRLITAGGTENDDVSGEMRPTPHLAAMPYLQQVLGSFGVVWSRSRLMKLGARGTVPLHCDIKYHWYHRVRVHVPIVTHPEVTFACGGDTVHMAAGEAWIFDNWRPHSVANGSDVARIHLVADTMGNERFWALASRGQWDRFGAPSSAPLVAYRDEAPLQLLTERFNAWAVMPPAELEGLATQLGTDLPLEGQRPETREATLRIVMLLRGFCSEWRQLWSLFADQPAGWPHYLALRKQLRSQLQQMAIPLYLKSNGALFLDALQQGVLRNLMNAPEGADAVADDAPGPAPSRRVRLERPVFIVAAPRSGSTLLFETLAESEGLSTLGGEAHQLVEQFAALQPATGGVESNRLDASHLTPDIAQAIHEKLARDLRNAQGRPPEAGTAVRLLEKTPKNALRIPFFRALFPDARFIFLWREPEDNLSSIIEAWRSGNFVTYPSLPGRSQPWSLLLPPGWRALQDRPLEEVAAFQWRVTNELILQDLQRLPRADWTLVRYDDFIGQPEREVRRLCAFADIPVDNRLQARLSTPLPAARHTLTTPAPGKWRKNEALLARVLPGLRPLRTQLLELGGT